jgi:crotonobetainyl-CoA:carnitine CoA-transferase CaiB-like acyl-CoA transferase
MEPKYWANFCKAIGREDFIPYQHDMGRREEVIRTIKEIFLTEERDEWFRRLRDAGSQVAPVYEIDEALSDPQAVHRETVLELEDETLGKVKQLGIPIKLSQTPGAVRSPPPLPGEHTEEIMGQLGYTRHEMDAFLKAGIIHTGVKSEPKNG